MESEFDVIGQKVQAHYRERDQHPKGSKAHQEWVRRHLELSNGMRTIVRDGWRRKREAARRAS